MEGDDYYVVSDVPIRDWNGRGKEYRYFVCMVTRLHPHVELNPCEHKGYEWVTEEGAFARWPKFGRLMREAVAVCERYDAKPGLRSAEDVRATRAAGLGPCVLCLDTRAVYYGVHAGESSSHLLLCAGCVEDLGARLGLDWAGTLEDIRRTFGNRCPLCRRILARFVRSDQLPPRSRPAGFELGEGLRV